MFILWDQIPTSRRWPRPRTAVPGEQRWHPLQAASVSCSSALKPLSENRKKKYLVDSFSISSEGTRSLQVRFPSRRLGAKERGVAGREGAWEASSPAPAPAGSHCLGGAQGPDTPTAIPPWQLCPATATLLHSYSRKKHPATQPRAPAGCWSLPGHFPTPNPTILSIHCWHFPVN